MSYISTTKLYSSATKSKYIPPNWKFSWIKVVGWNLSFFVPTFPAVVVFQIKKKKWKVALPRRQKVWIHSQANFVKSPCTVFGLDLDPYPAKRKRSDQSSTASLVTKSRERPQSVTERFSDFFSWSKLGHIYHHQLFAVCRQSTEWNYAISFHLSFCSSRLTTEQVTKERNKTNKTKDFRGQVLYQTSAWELPFVGEVKCKAFSQEK